MCYFSPRKQAWSSWNLVPQSCVMNASLSFILYSFSKWGQLCFCQHSWFWNKFQLLQACSIAVEKWHILNMTLPQNNSRWIKTPYPYFMNLVSNYLKKKNSIQYSKNQWYSIKNVVEITDQNRCILFGPPRIYTWFENPGAAPEYIRSCGT